MRRAAALLGTLLLVVGVSATSGEGKARHCGAAHRCHRRDQRVRMVSPRAPLPRRLGVDENEWSVYPTHNPVGTGRVEFDVTNFGMDAHDFSIRTGKGDVVSSTPLASRTSAVVKVSLPPGSYTLFCSLSGHEARGMRATLTVR
jgi:hypothetical protein